MGLLEEHGSDAVRYWAASARLGTDAAFEVGQMKIGRRLAIKVLNASKFALSFGDAADGATVLDASLVTDALDRAMLAGLADVVDKATAALESYDHTRALEITETFFWTFCDDYLELVKDRAYGAGAEAADITPETASARAALGIALDVLLRLFAPVLPFATEEVWSWWREGSVHRAPWPVAEPLRAAAGDGDPSVVAAAGAALAALRKVKSEAKVSMRAEITSARLEVPTALLAGVTVALGDVRAAGRATGALDVVEVPDAADATVVARDAEILPPEPKQKG
jgi:valyl-tRNA synthetase